jgi:urease accessory protein
MPTEANLSLLRLLQLTNSSFPIGSFSYSEGLESLVESGTVRDDSTLRGWLEDGLAFGPVRIEAAVMLRAYRAEGDGDRLRYWNDWIAATRDAEELRLQSAQTGRSFWVALQALLPLELARDLGDPVSWHFPIAFGHGAAGWRIPERSALTGFLHAWVSNLIGAGQRLIPLGQTKAQQVIAALHAPIDGILDELIDLKDDDLSSCGFGLGLACMRHETLYSRLFRS